MVNKKSLSQSVSQSVILHILLVDDDPGDAYLFREALRISGILAHVTVISDGREALFFLRDQERRGGLPCPHLIFMELELPSIHGHDVLHTLKQDPTVCHLPVIILTKSMWYADLVTSYHEHAGGHICKPFDFQMFQCLLEACVTYWLPYVTVCQQYSSYDRKLCLGSSGDSLFYVILGNSINEINPRYHFRNTM